MKRIVMDGPDKNSLGSGMLRHLLKEITEARGEPLLLTGAGDAFSAGLDLKEVASLDPANMRGFLDLLEEAIVALYTHPRPTVACVNGHAIAGGCVITLACDYRVCTTAPKVKLGLNEIALGVRFPPRIGAIVTRRVPPQHHERVLLGAGLVDPQTALQLNLVDELADDPMPVAEARLTALAAHPEGTYAATKAWLRGSTADDVMPQEEAERRIADAVPSWVSAEVKTRLAKALAR